MVQKNPEPFFENPQHKNYISMNAVHHTITFVGAGPGAADLITLRGVNALAQAQVVLYDALIDHGVLSHAHPDAILIDVGKRGVKNASCSESKKQADINAALIQYGVQYERVVRLKGGDPAIFGRLDEEIDAIVSVGLNYEIVPGVSSALAAAASAQTALTRRGVARSVRLLTASVGDDQPDNLWHTHLAPSETLVFYRGGQRRQAIAHILLEKSFAPDTPVIMVFGASWSEEAIVRLTLSELAHDQTQPHHAAPCIILVGASLRTVSL